jgi:hypothetical protein
MIQVGKYKYHVIARTPFEFYIRTDMIQNCDEERDSSLVLTQLSDYIFETIKTNGGMTEERLLVKSLEFDSSAPREDMRGCKISSSGMTPTTTKTLLNE